MIFLAADLHRWGNLLGMLFLLTQRRKGAKRYCRTVNGVGMRMIFENNAGFIFLTG